MRYLPGQYGYESGGRPLRIFESWIMAQEMVANGQQVFPSLPGEEYDRAQEAMSVSDFTTYMGVLYRHSFNDRYQEIVGRWTEYSRPMSVPDFETYTSSKFGRFPNIPEKPPGAPYEEITIRELPGPQVSLREWGAGFSLTRRLILSDRMDKIAGLPTLFAESFARTKSTEAINTVFESNPIMWDGFALISNDHGNMGSTALTADQAGAAALIAADLALMDQVDEEGYPININTNGTRTLLIPPELKYVAEALTSHELLPNVSNNLQVNQARGIITNTIIDPYLKDANDWFVLTDPTGPLAPMVALNLNGQLTPFIGQRDPGVRALSGGTDPYTFDFDELNFKGRDDYAFIATEWRGIYGSIVSN